MEIAANFTGIVALAVAYAAFVEAVTIRKNTQKLIDRLDRLDDLIIATQEQAGNAATTAATAKQVSLNAWNDSKSRHAELLERLSVSCDAQAQGKL